MSSKPLETPYREELADMIKNRKGLATATSWGLHRSTLAEAAAGMPKQESTRFLIIAKLKEKKRPI